MSLLERYRQGRRKEKLSYLISSIYGLGDIAEYNTKTRRNDEACRIILSLYEVLIKDRRTKYEPEQIAKIKKTVIDQLERVHHNAKDYGNFEIAGFLDDVIDIQAWITKKEAL